VESVNIAQTLLLADSWGMHDGDVGMGWWIIGVPFMLLMMGGMMWMMMRGMGGGSSPDSAATSESPGTPESPVEVLERRLAEGDISVEEYRARRAALVKGTDEPNGDHEDEPLTASGVEGRQ
jgi:putative membrane protein